MNLFVKTVSFLGKLGLLLLTLLALLLVTLYTYYWVRAGEVMASSVVVSRVELARLEQPLSEAEQAIDRALFTNPESERNLVCSQFESLLRQGKYRLGPSHDIARLVFAERDIPPTFESRIQQMFVACRIEAGFEHNVLLRWYLSQAYFGNGEFGIEDAAVSIFRKPSKFLSSEEGYALAALLWLPSLRNSPDKWVERQKQLQERAIHATK